MNEPAEQRLAGRLAPLAPKPPGTLLVHEIYRSIQGESRYAGLPCVFVRLTTCNLRCRYCDTPHAFTAGAIRSLHEVVAQVLAYGDPLVEVTGGEPLLQAECSDLLTQLCDAGRIVLLETGGACDIVNVDKRVHIIMDLKTPDSGESGSMLWSNIDHLKRTDEVKFVVCSQNDFDWSMNVIQKHQLLDRADVLISPAFGQVEPLALAEWVLAAGLPVRMQLQLHKLIWHPTQRGV